jgi:hypothetical protein
MVGPEIMVEKIGNKKEQKNYEKDPSNQYAALFLATGTAHAITGSSCDSARLRIRYEYLFGAVGQIECIPEVDGYQVHDVIMRYLQSRPQT